MKTEYFDIINSPLKGRNLIEASAGTGKTYALAGLFLRLILEKGILIDRILAVTYTEAATGELRSRIRSRLKDASAVLKDPINRAKADDELLEWVKEKFKKNETAQWRLRDAITRFDEASICTIHGFCRRMLSENAFESGTAFSNELLINETELRESITYDFYRKHVYDKSKMLLQYILIKKIYPDHFLGLLKFYSIDPDFKILPEMEKPDITGIEKEFAESYNDLRKAWESHKKDIEDILLSDNALKRNLYGVKSIPSWIMDMDNYLDSGFPLQIFDRFGKFTAGSVKSSVKKDTKPPEHEFFNICDSYFNLYERIINELGRYICYLEYSFFIYYKQESARRKKKDNLAGFDDLLLNLYNALKSDDSLAKEIRKRYSAALIDEFQDTDPVQSEIFLNLFGTGNSVLFLIGDPKQSIYRFRGADIFAYIKALNRIDGRYTLGRNWRSSPELVKAINTVFKRDNPFIFKEIEYNEIMPATQNEENALPGIQNAKSLIIRTLFDKETGEKDKAIGKIEAENLISGSVAGEIHKLISEGSKPRDIAVLVRKRHQAALIRNELTRFNIPGVLYGSGSIFSAPEAADIERLISSVADPGNGKKFLAALATDIIGLSGNEINDLSGNETGYETRINRFREYNDIWTKSGFFNMMMTLLTEERSHERLLLLVNGERKITNIVHLCELLHRAEADNKFNKEGVINWLHERRINPGEEDEHQIRLETDEDAVRLITIHRSKGLEYPVVFCPFLFEGSGTDKNKPFTYHDPDDSRNLTLMIDRESGLRSIAEAEELAENIRLSYVALTRAKYRTYVYWGNINKAETSALSYLFHSKSGKSNIADIINDLVSDAKFSASESMIRDLKNIASGCDSIVIEEMPEYKYRRLKNIVYNDKDLKFRKFTLQINTDWRVSSFSALAGSIEHAEIPDHDKDAGLHTGFEPGTGEKNIFTFPRGANSGSCIHEVFEKTNFMDADTGDDTIKELLGKYNIDAGWRGIIKQMINNVVNARLPDNMSLKNIANESRLNELEFYLPLTGITAGGLSGIFRDMGTATEGNLIFSLERLGFRKHRGFLKGYIDLVFTHKEKYYIIDWKSNYLGGNVIDYSIENINNAIIENYYFLQYYIYTVALNRLLSAKVRDYEYSKDFGGVFYFFVRGMNPDNPGSGIFFDLPAEENILKLDEYLTGREIIQL